MYVHFFFKEGDVRGVRKPQNRTEIRQKMANGMGFFFPNTETASTADVIIMGL